MSATVNRYTAQLAQQRGWNRGSSLENKFALKLSRLGIRANVDLLQQYPVDRYRIDFADPDVLIGIEADGFFHRMPGMPERDAARDAWLLTKGWYLIRISDECTEAELEHRLLCAVLLLREERVDQGLPWERDETARRRAKASRPSRLAYVAGYTDPPTGA